MARKLPTTSINLFQLIYILIREYKEKTGKEPLNLSLGNPDGVPDERVLALEARFAKDPAFSLHTYAEDNNLNEFAESMVELHAGIDVRKFPHLKATPMAGIKTATALLPLACGLHLPDSAARKNFRIVSNLPAYDVIGTWAGPYLGAQRIVWPLLSKDNMRLNIELLKEILKKEAGPAPAMVHVIRPGNPAAVGAHANEWKALIELCLEYKMRLVNDGAYTALCAPGTHTPLAQVAKDYPDLDWIEMFSLSKSFNDPGARLGALVGSKDFVDDYTLVKGNTDSGPVPFLMAAYGEFFKDKTATTSALENLRTLYQKRLTYVISQLKKAGFQPACETDAGFFTLWKCPTSVLGRDFKKIAAEERRSLSEIANRTIITETGIVGVHFEGRTAEGNPDPLLRYAVCTDVLSANFQKRFEEELARLKVTYS